MAGVALFCSVVIGVAGFFTLILWRFMSRVEGVNHLEMQEKMQPGSVESPFFDGQLLDDNRDVSMLKDMENGLDK